MFWRIVNAFAVKIFVACESVSPTGEGVAFLPMMGMIPLKMKSASAVCNYLLGCYPRDDMELRYRMTWCLRSDTVHFCVANQRCFFCDWHERCISWFWVEYSHIAVLRGGRLVRPRARFP